MSNEDNYSIKEVLESKFAEMGQHLTEIKAQTIKTNGRVNSLEKSRVQVWTAISVLLVVGGAVATLAIMAIDTKIANGIAQALQDNVATVEIAK